MKTLLLIAGVVISGVCFGQIPNTWKKKSDFAGLKRERAVAFTVDGYGYLGTGIDTAETVFNDLWKYDAITDSWSQVASLPGSVRRNAIAFSIGSKGYVGTGINTVNSTDPGATRLSDFWEYNPATNSWTQKANYPDNFGNGIYFSAAFTANGKGYVVGGKKGPNNYSDRLYAYDPNTNQWTQGPNFPGGVRYQLSALSVDDKGYVGLGTDQDLYRNDWWEYKPTVSQWVQRADLPASERAAATTFSIGSYGYVCMGTNGGMLDDLWEYNPGDNSWSSRAPYGGSPRKGAVAMVLYGRAYVGTGKGVNGKKASMHEYLPFQTAGIDELNNNLTVYPNPATDVIYFSSEVNADHISLLSTAGQVVKTTEGSEQMNVSDVAPGVYMIAAHSNGEITGSQKIIIR